MERGEGRRKGLTPGPSGPSGSSGVSGPLAPRIADAVRRWLATGVRFGPETCAFLEAQLDLPGLAALPGAEAAARLAPLLGAAPEGRGAGTAGHGKDGTTDQPAADAETALEYLFYPDTALRLTVERLLVHADWTASESAPDSVPDPDPAIASSLSAAVLRLLPPDSPAVLHLSETGNEPQHAPHAARLVLPVPGWAMAQLVRRLRLDRAIPAGIAEAVSHALPEPQALAVRLALRDARFELAETPAVSAAGYSAGTARESRPDLVLRFIQRMPPSDPGYVEALALWLDLLHDLPPGASAHAALSARRERLSRAAREADEFTERLGRLNMEILMLQGVHAPALDAAEARRRVRLMDRMCLAVLGRPAAPDPAEEGMAPDAPSGHDLGAFDPATGLDDLMRLLS
ncbi:hypothetical protein ACR4XJ_00025 [Nitratidesulfovibrio sp. D1]|uniref:hypothetical protein n=1 Tax=Nitratidesulfovibrio sp. D1 TaxID=3440151 RepID=UPI003EBC791F